MIIKMIKLDDNIYLTEFMKHGFSECLKVLC